MAEDFHEYAMHIPPQAVVGDTVVDEPYWLEAWRHMAEAGGYEPTGKPRVVWSEMDPLLREAPEFKHEPPKRVMVIGPVRRLTDQELRARNDIRVHITPPHRTV